MPEGGATYSSYFTGRSWVDDPPSPERDRELAGEAVIYLRARGLEDEAVIQCLHDEFEMDLPTAETMVWPPGGEMDIGLAAG